MITRGSKYFYGTAIVAFVTALVYGFITGASAHGGVVAVFQDGSLVDSIVGPLSFGWKGWVGEHIGYCTLMALAGVMGALGGFLTAFRDGDAEALAGVQGVPVERADLRVVTPQGLSYWPIIAAFAAGAAVVGLAVSSAMFVVGLCVLAIVAIEWTFRAWSERLSDDPAQNAALRGKLTNPVNIPVGAVIGVALIMFLMSRILLALPKVGSVFFIIAIAIAVFSVAILLSGRPHLKRSVSVAVLIIGGLLLIIGGIVGGMAGTYEGGEHGGEEGMTTITRPVAEQVVSAESIHAVAMSDGY